MTLACGGSIDQRRPQSANSRLRQMHPQDVTTSNNPFKDQEVFGQHMLKSIRSDVEVQDAVRHETDDRVIPEINSISRHYVEDENEDNCDNDEFDENSSETEQLAVVSAQEYAAKIIKIQQACLIPLKEDLADWLNKILKTSQITTSNFMDKLDNGVIICRLAKIISLWCEQQLDYHGNNVSMITFRSCF